MPVAAVPSENFIMLSLNTIFIMLSLNTIFIVLINLILWGGLIYLFVLLIRALRKYLRTENTKKCPPTAPASLADTLKSQRQRCNMTQEFVAEQLDVSRQAVSKWENGTAVPSTSNLLALTKLYAINPEQLLNTTQK